MGPTPEVAEIADIVDLNEFGGHAIGLLNSPANIDTFRKKFKNPIRYFFAADFHGSHLLPIDLYDGNTNEPQDRVVLRLWCFIGGRMPGFSDGFNCQYQE